MAQVHAQSARTASSSTLKELRRKSTETRMTQSPTAVELRRCSTSIADLVNTTDVAEGSMTSLSKHQRLKATYGQKAPPPNTWRRRIRQLMKYPHATRVGRIRHYGLLVAIVCDYILLMFETLDGPANGGSDPKYPHLPTATTYFYLDVAFTGLFAFSFALCWIVAKRQRKFWTQLVTWSDLLGLLPLTSLLVMKYAFGWSRERYAPIEEYLRHLRLFRIVRVTYMLRNMSGIRVLHATFLECIHPLQITLFFLTTIVMTLATLLYYAQPCYDGTKCTFTDIINTGYYVMTTVATVGYGDQVPDLTNPLAVVVAIAAMIFGALYLAMPLAIVGIKYELTWRRFENVSRTTRSTLELRAALKSISIQPLHAKSNHVNVLVHRTIDAIAHLTSLVQGYISIPDDAFYINDDALNQAFLVIHAAGDDAIARFQTLMRHLSPFLPPDFCNSVVSKPTAGPLPLQRRGSMLVLLAESVLDKAKRATLHRRDTPINVLDPNLTFRQRLRAHLRATNHGSRAHRFYLTSVLLSVAVFYAESVPELQAFGPTSHLCHMLMESYCTSNPSPATDPGCYVWHNTTALAVPLTKAQFYCDNDAKTERCFGVGFNHGGNASAGSCAAKFAYPAHVCSLRECQRGHEPLVDLTHHWIYIEVYLGITFTVELMLRCYVSSRRRHFFRSVSTWIDIMAILPFYAQTLAGLAAGRTPIYVSSPTFPTLLSILPIMKTLRIVKLGWYLQGSSVLARTAALTYERLAIPLFFLFLACASAGALFFEVERGTSCRAGMPCMYFGIDVMTTAISNSFPFGKRIQIYLDHLVLLKDMWRTTWMSAVTLTGVGYGDLTPRSPAGRILDILTMVFGSCYTAMPLSLIGGQFYQCYELYSKEKQARAGDVAQVQVDSTRSAHKATPTLRAVDCDLLESAQVVIHVVDEMMANLYKLHRMRPGSTVLNTPVETSIAANTSASVKVTAAGPRRLSLLARIAPTSLGPLLTFGDKRRQGVELRRLVVEASAIATTVALQLPRVVEAIVALTAAANDDE
ncbi:hypothetical protein H310_00339 [Aphanomyces invadans]|uniref:Ion transport domain-containing protein n=1 Tax=Aphanomyces invadans TaxID=157072 RepID=A0A024UVE7_9STRA|nr:hypothetical protein H310_00339 [Aphanomyces invadans]ETW09900.1 hypothetical protein H310_00339 [Aphanomyces invadans]|eukprot:XP_008861311.1 hypothetical protein H310_00339 [Aphanomyces invadans]